VIDRSQMRDTPKFVVALDAAKLFGTRVAETILAAVMCDRAKNRTYDRKRSDQTEASTLARRGPSTYGSLSSK
jgi:hypothetical protein